MLDAHQLNVFLTAAETLNFTQAGRMLNMTQPSVSQHIRELENRFGQALFDRSGKKVSLTDAGQALVPLARDFAALSIRIDERMQSLQGEVFGHLMVGCTMTPGRYILPGLLAIFLNRYPKVAATCHVSSRQRAVEMLLDGKLHVALAGAQDFSSDLEFRSFMSDPIVLITPNDHPWAEGKQITPSDLLSQDFILPAVGSGTRSTVMGGLRQVGIALDRIRAVLTVGSSEAIALAVQEGLGVAFVSRMVAERLVPHGVALIEVEGLELAQDICIGRNRRRAATTAQNVFWEFVTQTENLALNPARISNPGLATPAPIEPVKEIG